MSMAGQTGERPAGAEAEELSDALQAALLQAREPERFRLLARCLAQFAERPELDGHDHQGELVGLPPTGEAGASEPAGVINALAAARAALDRQSRELEAERRRCLELQRAADDQQMRWLAAEQRAGEVERRIDAQNVELGQARQSLDTLEASRRELIVQLTEAREACEQLRAEHATMAAELRASAGAPAALDPAEILTPLWARLAQVDPPLALPNGPPDRRAAERLVDAFIALALFAQDIDQTIHPFLESFTKHSPRVARPWAVYAREPRLCEVIQRIMEVAHGRPASVLTMRLVGLRRWVVGATLASDSALECIAEELEKHLRGPAGLGADPNRRVRDFLKSGGAELFHQHIRELRGQKLELICERTGGASHNP